MERDLFELYGKCTTSQEIVQVQNEWLATANGPRRDMLSISDGSDEDGSDSGSLHTSSNLRSELGSDSPSEDSEDYDSGDIEEGMANQCKV